MYAGIDLIDFGFLFHCSSSVYELHHIHSRQKKMGIAFPDVDLSFMYSCTKAEALDRWDSMDGVGWSAACDLLSQHVGLVWQSKGVSCFSGYY